MKIDLHLHTIQTKKGDGVSRDVSPEEFKRQLKDAGVGLGAITNHNMFDEQQFNDFLDKSYTLLPGVEVDFIEDDDEKRSQLNVIFSNNDVNSAVEFSKFLKYKNISSENAIPIKDLWNHVSNKEIILFADNKGGKTKVTNKCIEYIHKINTKKIPILHDANNIRTHRILMSSQVNSLIGSDVQSWKDNNYVEKDSLDLIESQWPIKNFNSFKSLLQLGRPIKEWLIKLENKQFTFKIDGDPLEIDILSSGVNIIIGDKATGKSKILEFIRKELPDDQLAYFSEDFKKEEYKKLTSSRSFIMKENESIENDVENKVIEITKLKKEKSNSPKEFRDNVLSPNNTNWKIQDSKLSNNPKVNFDFLFEFIKKINSTKKYLKENKSNLFLKKQMIKDFTQKIESIKNDVVSNFIKNEIEIISLNISDELKKGIRIIISELKGIKTNNLCVGLINLYKYKKEVEDKILYIKNTSLEKDENVILNEDVPTIGTLKLVDKNYLIPFGESKKLNKINSCKHVAKDLKIAIKVFDDFSFENLDDFKAYWTAENIEKGFVSTCRKILDKSGNDVELSSGQESILLLVRALDKDVDYILLDEPSARIGSNAIMKYINKKIMKLRRTKKTIIITTHNSSLGINILPNKYILRVKDESGNFKTLWSYIYGDFFMDKNSVKDIEFKFNDVVMDLLEGGKDSYEDRKGIYESKINN